MLNEIAEDFLKDFSECALLVEDSVLKATIENKFLRIERELSNLLVEIDKPAKVRPIVDAVVEHCISLIRNIENQIFDEGQTVLCIYYGEFTCLFIFQIRKKYNYLSIAQLECPKLYVDFFKNLMKNKTEIILEHMSKACLPAAFIEAMSDYFQSPIPTAFSVSGIHDGFLALDYYYGLIEVMYYLCCSLPLHEYQDAIYYELINRNFNRLEFIRSAIDALSVPISEDMDIDREIIGLLEKKKEIARIPSLSGVSYIASEESLKNVLLNAITEEIKFLNDYQSYKTRQLGEKFNPQFSNNFNIWQLLFLFNLLVNLGFWKRVGKLSIPEFVHLNFVRSDGEPYSLKSLVKKNSNIDPLSAKKLIEALKSIIEYITKHYLILVSFLVIEYTISGF